MLAVFRASAFTLLLLLASTTARAGVDLVDFPSIWSKPVAFAPPKGTRADQVKQWLSQATGDATVAQRLADRLLAGSVRGSAEDAASHYLVLANENIGLLIGHWGSPSPYVASLYHFPTQTPWARASAGPLWETIWKSSGHPDLTWSSTAVPQCGLTRVEGKTVATLHWPAAPVPGAGPGQAAVTATISLGDEDPAASFDFSIDNQLGEAGLWKIRYPILHGVAAAGQCDALSDTLGTSRLIRSCREELNESLYALQVRAITMGASTLYLATQDPRSSQKYYHFKPGAALDVMVYPANMGVAGKSYQQGFPVEIGALTGDWFDAAVRYREWAGRQAWAKRGPVAGWQGPGAQMAKVMLWLQTLSPEAKDVPATVASLKKTNASAGVKLGVHYYQWWSGDAFFPKILRNGFRQGMPQSWDELRAAGMPILPYYNVLYWKLGTQRTDQGVRPETAEEKAATERAIKEGACVPFSGADGDDAAGEKFNARGDHYIVEQGQNLMMPMCRLTPLWQKAVFDLTRLLEQNGNDMVYLDQGGVPPRSPCFDPSHGHELGGGDQWARGTREMVRQIKFDTGRELAICSECSYEGYLDLVEMQFKHYWPWLSPRDALCPLFEAVYHDQTLFLSAVKPHRDPNAYALDIGTRLLHGNEFRAEARLFDNPALADHASFLLRMARLRSQGAAFLAEGRMIRPPDWSQAPATLDADWLVKDNVVSQRVRFPVLERAAYVAPDGREAVFVVNFSSEPQTASLDLARWGGASLQVTGSDGKSTSLASSASVTIPPRDGVMLTK